MKVYWRTILILAVSWLTIGSCLGASDIQGQKPVPLFTDGFRFQPGTWGIYDVQPKGTAATHRIYFAVLEEVTQKKGKAYWMEVEVTTADTPAVVTRLLLPATTNGPGDALEAIVQVAGYRPFTVPRRYLKPDPKSKSAQVGQFIRFTMPTGPVVQSIDWKGRTVRAMDIKVMDANEQPVQVVVSEEVPPLCILRFDSPDTLMKLVDWGNGAKTKIIGKPVGMWRWIMGLFGSAMSGSTPAQSN
jgi:hypothetical protein